MCDVIWIWCVSSLGQTQIVGFGHTISQSKEREWLVVLHSVCKNCVWCSLEKKGEKGDEENNKKTWMRMSTCCSVCPNSHCLMHVHGYRRRQERPFQNNSPPVPDTLQRISTMTEKSILKGEICLLLVSLRAHSHLAHLLRAVPKHDCSSSPVPPTSLNSDCSVLYQAWARFTSWRSTVAAQRSNNTENMTWLTSSWRILCGFGPLTFLEFFDYARQRCTRWWLYFMSRFYAPMHEHQQPCEGQGGVLCLSTVQSAHTSQSNWTLGVKCDFAWYGWPSVSSVTFEIYFTFT